MSNKYLVYFIQSVNKDNPTEYRIIDMAYLDDAAGVRLLYAANLVRLFPEYTGQYHYSDSSYKYKLEELWTIVP